MNTRLQQFISAENLSQSQFADTIGVARASVSHILAGRNKPGFDFIESMSRHYPSLNLEWLITGKGKMYKGAVQSPASQEQFNFAPTDDLFAAAEEDAEMTAGGIWNQPRPVAPQSPAQTSPAQASPAGFGQNGFAAAPSSPAGQNSAAAQASPAAKQSSPLFGAISQNNGVSRAVSRIIIFYDDNTFQELK